MKTAIEVLAYMVINTSAPFEELTAMFDALPKEERAKIRDVIEIDKGEKG